MPQKKLAALFSIAISVIVAASGAMAQEPAGSPDLPALPDLGVSPETSLKLVITLLVFACIVGFYFLKRANLIGFRANAKSDISLEQQFFLTAKEKVIVLAVAEERFLLGVTQSQINLIARLDGVPGSETAADDAYADTTVVDKYRQAGHTSPTSSK